MSGDIAPYLARVTSEHATAPKFIAALSALLQPMADNIATLGQIDENFDIDIAIGPWLDIDGLWIGASRELLEPLTGVYFSFDTAGVGFDQGVWFAPFDPVEGLVRLDDPSYRTLLKATILANRWNGTIPQLYAILAELFAGPSGALLTEGSQEILTESGQPILLDQSVAVLIQDNGDMSFLIALMVPLSAVALALIVGGYLKIKPAGVRLNIIEPSDPPKLFGFDVETSSLGGFDEGSWPTVIAQF